MSVKRLSQIPALVYEKLAKELIDDWEIVANEFSELFNHNDIIRYRSTNNKLESARLMLDRLKNCAVLIKKLYKSLKELRLESAYCLLEPYLILQQDCISNVANVLNQPDNSSNSQNISSRTTFENNEKPVVYVSQLSIATISKICNELLDNWEDVAIEFNDLFDLNKIRLLKEEKTSYDSVFKVLERLSHAAITVLKLYRVLRELNFESSYELLKEYIPEDKLNEIEKKYKKSYDTGSISSTQSETKIEKKEINISSSGVSGFYATPMGSTGSFLSSSTTMNTIPSTSLYLKQ